jgi:16S rRNA (cytosine1402-N4)-methyltransferase
MRRPRYNGTHPKSFTQKYKELDPERYPDDVEKVKQRGQTPAGSHRPICVAEILQVLRPEPGNRALDCTLGWGGHSAELLARVQPGGLLVATDVDPRELPRSEARLRALGFPPESLVVKRQNFSQLATLPESTGGPFDVVLADLGISSMQVDDPGRGFSFKATGPLDLRLDPGAGISAAQLLNSIAVGDLERMLREHADEPHAARIAAALCDRRGAVRTTTDLVNVVRKSLARRELDEDVLKKTFQRCFQALRIAVNDEFGALDAFLRDLPRCLTPGARVAILTFHSGEESRVRAAFETGKLAGTYAEISGEPLRASAQERYDNPRSKSARLHWAKTYSDRLLGQGDRECRADGEHLTVENAEVGGRAVLVEGQHGGSVGTEAQRLGSP